MHSPAQEMDSGGFLKRLQELGTHFNVHFGVCAF